MKGEIEVSYTTRLVSTAGGQEKEKEEKKYRLSVLDDSLVTSPRLVLLFMVKLFFLVFPPFLFFYQLQA